MAESPEEVRPRHEVPSPTYRLTLIAFVTLALIGGGNGVAIRFSNRELPPFWGASLRFSVAAALFFAVVLIRHTVSVTVRMLGCCCNTGHDSECHRLQLLVGMPC